MTSVAKSDLSLRAMASSVLLFVSVQSQAYDFSVEGIYYNITSTEKMEVEVTQYSPTPSENRSAYQGEVTLPSELRVGPMQFTVTRIGDDAFSQCISLTKINLPKSVISIGQCAFRGCTSLTEIHFPIEVKTIEPRAFEDCTGLTQILLEPYGVTDIGSCAFRRCSNLRTLNIPYGVTTIDTYAFADCHSLEKVEMANSVVTINEGAFSHCYGLHECQLSGSVTDISTLAFEYCYGLNYVSIPASVTHLGDGAFRGCYSLNQIDVDGENQNYLEFKGLILNHDKTELICTSCIQSSEYLIPNTVTEIHDFAFMGCPRVSNLVIPKSVHRIGREAFCGCSLLYVVEIPSSVYSIGEKAFDGTTWYENQPDGLVNAGLVAYRWKGILDSNSAIMLRDNTIGIADCAFAGQKNLVAVTLPNKLQHIGFSAFRGCNLSSIEFPKNVAYIGDMAFCECKELSAVICHNATVPEMGEKVFLQINIDQCSLAIPAKSKELYSNASGWNTFKLIQEIK